MPVRIRAADLPPRKDAGAQFLLGWRAGSESRADTLESGETIVGSSPRCHVRIEAPGVKSRHLRFKRSKDRIFVQPLPGATVFLDGEKISGLTRVEEGGELGFGAVRAVVERLSADDARPAVTISVAAPVLRDVAHRRTPAATQSLAVLNDALENVVVSGGAGAADSALDALREAFAPASATLHRRTKNGEWMLLAEHRDTGATDLSDPGEAVDGATVETVAIGDDEFRFAVLFSEDGDTEWKREFCRGLALQLALGRRAAAGGGETPVRGVARKRHAWDELIGSRIRAHLADATDLCAHSDSVLVIGQTGTGKELVARSLHRLWGRKGDLVAINCAAVPGDLLDSELFGVEAGAATGVNARRGRFEQAEGGTLFLDEVAEIGLPLQSKLLRVLQEREFFSVGGSKLRRADVKIVAATNIPPADLLAGKMRQDLYFRLAQGLVTLPPLCDRDEDLAALIEAFLRRLEAEFGRGVVGMSHSALAQLRKHAWPGNVRELQNLVRMLYARAPAGGLIQSIHLPPELRRGGRVTGPAPTPAAAATGGGSPLAYDASAPPRPLADIVDEIERQVIATELARQRSVADAAHVLGLSEGYLYRKLKKLGLRPLSSDDDQESA